MLSPLSLVEGTTPGVGDTGDAGTGGVGPCGGVGIGLGPGIGVILLRSALPKFIPSRCFLNTLLIFLSNASKIGLMIIFCCWNIGLGIGSIPLVIFFTILDSQISILLNWFFIKLIISPNLSLLANLLISLL